MIDAIARGQQQGQNSPSLFLLHANGLALIWRSWAPLISATNHGGHVSHHGPDKDTVKMINQETCFFESSDVKCEAMSEERGCEIALSGLRACCVPRHLYGANRSHFLKNTRVRKASTPLTNMTISHSKATKLLGQIRLCRTIISRGLSHDTKK